MQASIGGSAKIQGTAATAGLTNGSSGSAAVNRSKLFWLAAVGVLIIFHVGGARV